jgi:DNA-binding FadR family transcriptional regulator
MGLEASPITTSGTRRRDSVHLADSIVEATVGQIKDLIESRNLGVGDPLPSERELCEMFSASRNTVREAMRILKTYGVVEVRPKTGAVLIDRRMDAVFNLYSFNTLELSRQTYLDTQGFRQLIEVGAVDQLFEHVTGADVANLRTINDTMQGAESPQVAALEDYRFHARLVAIVDNQHINEIYGIIKPVMLKIMENGLALRKFGAGENFGEHASIIDALESRNRVAYQFHAGRHLEVALALFKGIAAAAEA